MRGDGTNGTDETASDETAARNGAAAASSTNNKASIANVLNESSDSRGSSNGVSNGTLNGSGASYGQDEIQTFYGHDREEVTRILIQGLYDLGYNDSAEKLSDESGFDLETRYAAAFREAILHGDWAKAEALLTDTDPPPDGGGVGIGNGSNGHTKPQNTGKRSSRHRQRGLPLSEDADKLDMLFQIRRQKYLEVLESGIENGTLAEGLAVLRQELTPLHQDERELHSLSSLIMCTSAEDLKIHAEWDGVKGSSRRQLLSELSRSISPSVMIPEHRLANLFDQISETQINNCLYHNKAELPSLYQDHRCEHDQLPLQTLVELTAHRDEVWFLQFSPDGSKLATASKDSKVYIFDTETLKPLRILSDHRSSVAYVAWSPDNRWLVSCSQDKTARLWSVESGTCARTIDYHQECVTTAAWTHDSTAFATGSHDADLPLCLWSRTGSPSEEPAIYKPCARVQDCAITSPHAQTFGFKDPDASSRPARLVAVGVDQSIHVFDLVRRDKLATFSLGSEITCLNMSIDGLEALVNLGTDKVLLIDIETGEERKCYLGQKQGSFVIRSCFGGASEGFVVSGGEDARISIWHRHSGTLLEKFAGHREGCVNAVAWNKARPYMFASAGDDAKVRVWVSPVMMAAYAEQRRQRTPDLSRQEDTNMTQDGNQSLGPPQWGSMGGLGGGLGGLPAALGRR